MLPTSGLGWDSEMEDDPALAAATMRAYNRWIEDDWGYAHEGRLFAPPCISLLDVDAAVTEVDRVLSLLVLSVLSGVITWLGRRSKRKRELSLD